MRYPADWKFEEKESVNALYSFRLYNIEEDDHRKEFLEKYHQNLQLEECVGSSSVWWAPGIHITLMNNPQKLELRTLADEWNNAGYIFGHKIFRVDPLEVSQGTAKTKLGQDAFLFLNPSGDTEFLVEVILSHSNLTEQVFSSFEFIR